MICQLIKLLVYEHHHYSHHLFFLQQVGHKEDILSVSQCPPNLLATSSYDGEVIIWNLVSGHIFCHLKAPEITPEDDHCKYILWYEYTSHIIYYHWISIALREYMRILWKRLTFSCSFAKFIQPIIYAALKHTIIFL